MTLADLTEHLQRGEDLPRASAESAARLLAEDPGDIEEKRAFLLQLTKKGEKPQEVAAFARVFRELARDPGVGDLAARAIDVCGTGGDHAGSFNISTTVGLLLAASGVPVFKHGNRSITSKCGSADLLEALGIPLEAEPDLIRKSLETLHFCFFFAPNYHPAFKAIMPVRKTLAAEGHRTIFNLLGPLINPGQPAHQLMGVFAPDWVAPIADTLGEIGLRRGLVVHSRLPQGGSLDELSCAGTNILAGCGEIADTRGERGPGDFDLPACPVEDLAGGDLTANLAILDALLDGAAPSGLRDTICLNAGAGLWVAGKVDSIAAGIVSARTTLEGGALRDWLERARTFYANV